MTLPAFASLAQFAARVPGGVPDSEEARAEAALADASTKVRAEANRSWVVDDELALPGGDDAWRADIIVSVTLSAALRAFLNPDGVTQERVVSYEVSYAATSTDVYLTAQERRQIRKAAGLPGLWTQPTTRGDLETPPVGNGNGPTTFVEVEPAGEPIAWE